MNTNLKKKKGFSLIELLITIIIISICVPAFYKFLNSTILNVRLSSNFTSAIFLAQNKIEELIYKDFNDDELRDTVTANNLNLNFRVDAEKIIKEFSSYVSSNFDHYQIINYKNTRFYIFWNVADDNTINPTINFKRVVVIVFWIEKGKGHQVSLETLKRET